MCVCHQRLNENIAMMILINFLIIPLRHRIQMPPKQNTRPYINDVAMAIADEVTWFDLHRKYLRRYCIDYFTG